MVKKKGLTPFNRKQKLSLAIISFWFEVVPFFWFSWPLNDWDFNHRFTRRRRWRCSRRRYRLSRGSQWRSGNRCRGGSRWRSRSRWWWNTSRRDSIDFSITIVVQLKKLQGWQTMSLQSIALFFRIFLLLSFQSFFFTFLAAAATGLLLQLELGYLKRNKTNTSPLIKWTTHKQPSIHLKEYKEQPKIDPSLNILGNPESLTRDVT